ncbi:MAG: DUF4430 domain-containing protein [Oscillospiraceae bacterium]|nr:DUF4430 domain-containing protein [Ruminiclostridium sp.]MBP3660031.1 DUF4430 domain-containing protein [Oscillospiraceae bacterium]
MKKLIPILLCLVLALGLFACTKESTGSLWDTATYTADAEVGEGSKTLTLEVTMEEKTITLTVHTDAETVGAALLENGIIAGDEGPYGLYIKEVIGVTADYDVDQTYWAFYIDGEYGMEGIDLTELSEDAVYGLTRTRG